MHYAVLGIIAILSLTLLIYRYRDTFVPKSAIIDNKIQQLKNNFTHGACLHSNNFTCFPGFLGLAILNGTRFGKSTHISMISNSVTHLQSYANSKITDVARNSAPILPETPRKCQCRHAELRYRLAEGRCLCRYHRIEWRVFKCFVMFHNVLIVFHDGSQCFKCFIMFH